MDLGTFTEEFLDGKVHFLCTVITAYRFNSMCNESNNCLQAFSNKMERANKIPLLRIDGNVSYDYDYVLIYADPLKTC